jgi:hypothetical protein
LADSQRQEVDPPIQFNYRLLVNILCKELNTESILEELMEFVHSPSRGVVVHKTDNGGLAKNIALISSVLSLIEKLLPFWASSIISLPAFSVVLGILSYFSAGKLYSRFCNRFSPPKPKKIQAITKGDDSGMLAELYGQDPDS